MKHKLIIIAIIIGTFGITDCHKENSLGNIYLLDLISEPAGVNCVSGGVKIIGGIDKNENQSLDADEILTNKYICNGIGGQNSILNIVSEPAGDNCEDGGKKIISGIDLNQNNTLEESEIQNTDFICNGNDGNDGYSSLLSILPETAGENCEYGGKKISSGLDLNSNGILDEDEVLNTEFICNSYGESEIVLDLISNISNSSTTPNVFPANIPHFDIGTYSNVTSVTFVVFDIRTITHTMGPIEGEGIIELYDMTNDKVIENSIIQSDDIPENTSLSSPNLIEYLPQERIQLGIRIRSTGDFTTVCGRIYLILSS